MTTRILALIALLAPLPAIADEAVYFGVGLFNWTYDEDNVPAASANSGRFTLGRQINMYLSLEAQFATGGSDTVPVFVSGVGTIDVDVELENSFSLMLRPHTPGNEVRAYGLFGVSSGEVTASAGGSSESQDDTGLSYGAGFEVAIGDNAWLNLEYVNYLRADAYTFDAVTAGTRIEF